MADPPPEPDMLDPIRLAFRPPGSLNLPGPPDRGPELGPDEAIPIPGELAFDEVLQGLNPLHHLPGVGMIYRAVTGTEIHPAMRALGAGITGGPLGMALAGVMSAIEMTQPLERIRAAMAGEPDPLTLARQPVASADVNAAYQRWSELANPTRLAAATAAARALV
ncbi:hypothetical protein [Sediminicoccus sp. KRV36]|uniref:hypothetical protein n=1 Tax=Sediminicoccus sp. KRV36 TaxID=3133721 RepID=UPI00200F52D3|nr:hypothetical protein [Sediminicoccus rosea]UPY36623.1 hypothetical protein LHU95_20740 [Sediminicoccus rosea]